MAVLIVNVRGSSEKFTSSHTSGIDTVAPGSGRTLNGATIDLAVPVLEVVEVDLVAALRDVARDRRDVAELAQHDAREQLAERARLLVRASDGRAAP